MDLEGAAIETKIGQAGIMTTLCLHNLCQRMLVDFCHHQG